MAAIAPAIPSVVAPIAARHNALPLGPSDRFGTEWWTKAKGGANSTIGDNP
jgi:hypothetical protein